MWKKEIVSREYHVVYNGKQTAKAKKVYWTLHRRDIASLKVLHNRGAVGKIVGKLSETQLRRHCW